MMRQAFTLSALLLALPAPLPGQELQQLIAHCESCHGPGGVSEREDIPDLAGRSADYIAGAIDEYYFFERHCPPKLIEEGNISKPVMDMCNVAADLSDEEIREVAEHFARSGTAPD